MGCGPQIAVEEDMVVKLGPLVAVPAQAACSVTARRSACSRAQALVSFEDIPSRDHWVQDRNLCAADRGAPP